MSSDEGLKACPFCGEVPKLTEHYKDGGWSLIHRCASFGHIVIDWTTKESVLRRWNTRALTPADTGVERMREALERIAGLVSVSRSSSDHDRLHAALDALDKARDIARAATDKGEE